LDQVKIHIKYLKKKKV